MASSALHWHHRIPRGADAGKLGGWEVHKHLRGWLVRDGEVKQSIDQSINQIWSCRSAKEFSGHTYTSLRSIYMSRLVRNAKMKQNLETVTPLQVIMIFNPSFTNLSEFQKVSKLVMFSFSWCLQVLEYARLVYKPGTERKMATSMEAHRQRVIDHFERKIELLGIKDFIWPQLNSMQKISFCKCT